jgi:hypothetical protein
MLMVSPPAGEKVGVRVIVFLEDRVFDVTE